MNESIIKDKESFIYGLIKRNILWIVAAAAAVFMLAPASGEFRTFYLVVIIEALAITLSGLAVYAFTLIDLAPDNRNSGPGYIFLGVHICTGLTVLGVYIAQLN